MRQAQAELDKVFDTVYNMYDDPAEIRDALLDLVPAIARKYGNLGSVAAAEWYDRMRAKWFKDDGYSADSTYDPDDVPMRQTVRRMAGNLWPKDDGAPPDPDLMLRGLHAAMDRWVKAGGRETITKAVRNDPRKPRFARVPQGVTCSFCLMLASRGFVYSSAEAAGGDMNDYHHDCDCEPIPSWDKKNPKIEGYDPDKLYEKYSACRSTIENLLTEERYRKTYVDTFVPKYDSDEPVTFDTWMARQIVEEMDWRSREWLNGGQAPNPRYSPRALKKKKLETQSGYDELITAWRLQKNGIETIFKPDVVNKYDPKLGRNRDFGLSDLMNGIEIKTLRTTSSKNTIDRHLKDTSNKLDAKRVVFDNTENTGMTDEELIRCIVRSRRFKSGMIYIIGKDEKLLRIK